MKWFSISLLLSLSPVYGQNSVDEFLAEGMKKSASTITSITQEDQKALIAAASAVLVKHLTFRADGTASAYFTLGDRRSVEWKKFVVSSMTEQTVTEADKLNGITKKYSVVFGCDAHRAWDIKTNRWGEWLAHGFSDFPLGILFQYKNGTWTPEPPALLKHFVPGPGPSISQSKPKPADKTNTLPPGMQKLK